MILESLLGRSSERLARKWSESPGVLLSRRQSAAGVDVSEEDSLSLSGVFAAVQLLSSIVGSLPLNVHRSNGKLREVANDLSVQYLLHDEYNPEMTASVARRTSEFHRLLWGNEYTEIVRAENNDIVALWPLEPWRVHMDRRGGELGWRVDDIDGADWIPDSEMLHTSLISSDGIEGRGFIEFALKSLGVSLAMQEFSERFFGNDAKPGGLLKHPGFPKKEARTELKKEWTAEHGGPANKGKVGVLWGGWDWIEGDGVMELDKAQLLESKRFQIEETARWFNIPPHLLRDLSRATFSNIEEQGIDFVVYTLMPPLVNKEQEYKRKLLKNIDRNLYAKHNVSALLRGNSAARSAFYREMFGIGVFSQNMILEFEDQNPIEGGDIHWVPVNMQPIEKAIAPPPEVKPVPAPAPENPAPKPPAEPNDQPRPDLAPILADAISRLARKEANDARRAAKKPDQFLTWMDGFYPRFEATLAQAIAPFNDKLADELAVEWCNESREQLLELAGRCKPKELSELVELKLSEWANVRPEAMAAKALENQCQNST